MHTNKLHTYSEPDKVLEPYDISNEVKESLLKNIARRLTPQPIKLRADIEVTCFGREGKPYFFLVCLYFCGYDDC